MRPGLNGQQPGQNISDDIIYIQIQKKSLKKALF